VMGPTSGLVRSKLLPLNGGSRAQLPNPRSLGGAHAAKQRDQYGSLSESSLKKSRESGNSAC
jgi:hypothetical protein